MPSSTAVTGGPETSFEAQRQYATEGGSPVILAIYHLLGEPALP